MRAAHRRRSIWSCFQFKEARYLEVRAEILIDLDGRNLLQLVEITRLGEVVYVQIVADVGLWELRHDGGRDRIDPAGRDDVVGKYLQDPPAVRIHNGGCGIVDRVLEDVPACKIGPETSALYGEVVAEIAREVFGVRHRGDAVIKRFAVAISFEVEEEERLVVPVIDVGNPHGTADRTAVIGQVLHDFLVMPGTVIGKRNAGVERRVLDDVTAWREWK